DAMGSAPAKAVAADADAVAQRLAAAEYQIEPPLAGVDDNGPRCIVGRKHHRGPPDRACAAATEETRTAAHDVTGVGTEEPLGLRVTGHRKHRPRRQQ